MVKYEVLEHEIKESVSGKTLGRYYTVSYQRKKYYFFGPLIWANHKVKFMGEYSFYEYSTYQSYEEALEKCNELNSEWVKTFLIMYNSKYSVFNETLINRFTGEHHKQRYLIYKKFLIDIPWISFDNSNDATVEFNRLVGKFPRTYISSSIAKK